MTLNQHLDYVTVELESGGDLTHRPSDTPRHVELVLTVDPSNLHHFTTLHGLREFRDALTCLLDTPVEE